LTAPFASSNRPANQQVTRDWWQRRRAEFACLASQEVVGEASRGDPEQVRRRLAVLASLPRAAAGADAVALKALSLILGPLWHDEVMAWRHRGPPGFASVG
jgi:hypothetical protein